jgi:hypothetical protein
MTNKLPALSPLTWQRLTHNASGIAQTGTTLPGLLPSPLLTDDATGFLFLEQQCQPLTLPVSYLSLVIGFSNQRSASLRQNCGWAHGHRISIRTSIQCLVPVVAGLLPHLHLSPHPHTDHLCPGHLPVGSFEGHMDLKRRLRHVSHIPHQTSN